jgi:hypothetical protein
MVSPKGRPDARILTSTGDIPVFRAFEYTVTGPGNLAFEMHQAFRQCQKAAIGHVETRGDAPDGPDRVASLAVINGPI